MEQISDEKFEGSNGESSALTWGKNIPERGNSQSKGPEGAHGWK